MRLKIQERDLLQFPPGLAVRLVISLPRSWGPCAAWGSSATLREAKEDPAGVYVGVEFAESAALQTSILERFLSEGGEDGVGERSSSSMTRSRYESFSASSSPVQAMR